MAEKVDKHPHKHRPVYLAPLPPGEESQAQAATNSEQGTAQLFEKFRQTTWQTAASATTAPSNSGAEEQPRPTGLSRVQELQCSQEVLSGPFLPRAQAPLRLEALQGMLQKSSTFLKSFKGVCATSDVNEFAPPTNTTGSTPVGPVFGGSGSSYGPKTTDIQQGALGDCYLLSTLASLAEIAPQWLMQHIQQDPAGGWDVTLYSKNAKGEFEPTVEHVLPSDLSQSQNAAQNKGALWPEIYAAALDKLNNTTHFINQENGSTASGYGALGAGGTASEIFEAVTGLPASTYQTDPGNLAALQNKLASLTQGASTASSYGLSSLQALAQAHPEWVKSVGSNGIPVLQLPDGSTLTLVNKTINGKSILYVQLTHADGTSIELPADHCYTLLSVDAKDQSVKLRNPWGSASYVFDQSGKELSTGSDPAAFSLSIADLNDLFSILEYQSPSEVNQEKSVAGPSSSGTTPTNTVGASAKDRKSSTTASSKEKSVAGPSSSGTTPTNTVGASAKDRKSSTTASSTPQLPEPQGASDPQDIFFSKLLSESSYGNGMFTINGKTISFSGLMALFASKILKHQHEVRQHMQLMQMLGGELTAEQGQLSILRQEVQNSIEQLKAIKAVFDAGAFASSQLDDRKNKDIKDHITSGPNSQPYAEAKQLHKNHQDAAVKNLVPETSWPNEESIVLLQNSDQRADSMKLLNKALDMETYSLAILPKTTKQQLVELQKTTKQQLSEFQKIYGTEDNRYKETEAKYKEITNTIEQQKIIDEQSSKNPLSYIQALFKDLRQAEKGRDDCDRNLAALNEHKETLLAAGVHEEVYKSYVEQIKQKKEIFREHIYFYNEKSEKIRKGLEKDSKCIAENTQLFNELTHELHQAIQPNKGSQEARNEQQVLDGVNPDSYKKDMKQFSILSLIGQKKYIQKIEAQQNLDPSHGNFLQEIKKIYDEKLTYWHMSTTLVLKPASSDKKVGTRELLSHADDRDQRYHLGEQQSVFDAIFDERKIQDAKGDEKENPLKSLREPFKKRLEEDKQYDHFILRHAYKLFAKDRPDDNHGSFGAFLEELQKIPAGAPKEAVIEHISTTPAFREVPIDHSILKDLHSLMHKDPEEIATSWKMLAQQAQEQKTVMPTISNPNTSTKKVANFLKRNVADPLAHFAFPATSTVHHIHKQGRLEHDLSTSYFATQAEADQIFNGNRRDGKSLVKEKEFWSNPPAAIEKILLKNNRESPTRHTLFQRLGPRIQTRVASILDNEKTQKPLELPTAESIQETYGDAPAHIPQQKRRDAMEADIHSQNMRFSTYYDSIPGLIQGTKGLLDGNSAIFNMDLNLDSTFQQASSGIEQLSRKQVQMLQEQLNKSTNMCAQISGVLDRLYNVASI